MNIYIWEAAWPSSLVVIAESLEEARQFVRDHEPQEEHYSYREGTAPSDAPGDLFYIGEEPDIMPVKPGVVLFEWKV